MPITVPTIQTGTGAATITVSPARRQMLLQNTDATATVTLSWNGAGGTWTLSAGDRIGILITGGVTQVTIGGSGSWQLLLQA